MVKVSDGGNSIATIHILKLEMSLFQPLQEKFVTALKTSNIKGTHWQKNTLRTS